MKPITYIQGDVIEQARLFGAHNGIVHVVNNAGRWGAGFTRALTQWEPLLEEDFRMARMKLGSVRVSHVGHHGPWVTSVFHVCAMDGVRRSGVSRPLSYTALDEGLRVVGSIWSPFRPSCNLYMPRIGCGLAGGTWEVVEPLIRSRLCALDLSVIVCDLPPKPKAA